MTDISSDVVLSIDNLHKTYGKITAVDQLNLKIKRGSVFGLLGPNGSGKTTTLGMVLNVTNASSGSYSWFGTEGSHEQRKRIGAILEKPNFYPKLSARKNLKLICKIKEVGEERIDETLAQVGLSERADYPFQTYSLGMKQRLAIASALLSHPEVLILDEPTNGLDPKGILEIRQLILDIAASGKTIILASHLLDEVQKVCSEFAILRNGKLIHTGRVDAGFGNQSIVEIAADKSERLLEVLKSYPGYEEHRILKGSYEVKFNSALIVSDLSKHLMNKGIAVTKFIAIEKNLEQQFIEILASND